MITKKQLSVYDDHPKAVRDKIAEMQKQGWQFKRKIHKYSGIWKMKYYRLFFERQLYE